VVVVVVVVVVVEEGVGVDLMVDVEVMVVRLAEAVEGFKVDLLLQQMRQSFDIMKLFQELIPVELPSLGICSP